MLLDTHIVYPGIRWQFKRRNVTLSPYATRSHHPTVVARFKAVSAAFVGQSLNQKVCIKKSSIKRSSLSVKTFSDKPSFGLFITWTITKYEVWRCRPCAKSSLLKRPQQRLGFAAFWTASSLLVGSCDSSKIFYLQLKDLRLECQKDFLAMKKPLAVWYQMVCVAVSATACL